MSALPKPSIYPYSTPSKHYTSKRRKTKPVQRDWASPESTERAPQQPTVESKSKTYSPQTSQFPQVQNLPAKLRVLLLLQKSSLGVAFILITASIAVYISTVRIPELWSKKYQDLETLQRQERELVAANESLKHKLAQQAQQEDSNLMLIKANNAIFIPPAPLSQSQKRLPSKPMQVYPRNIPMGY